MKLFIPEIKKIEICGVCGKHKKSIMSDHYLSYKDSSYYHEYEGRLETDGEAAYRTGYSAGYEKAADRAHWGIGWD